MTVVVKSFNPWWHDDQRLQKCIEFDSNAGIFAIQGHAQNAHNRSARHAGSWLEFILNLNESEDIRNKLLIARLPAMPQILLKLMELCQDEDAGMAEIAELVATDAGITSRLMKIANSAAYQRATRAVNLLEALNTVGIDLIKTVVICESVFQTFHEFAHTGSTDLSDFWKHSLSTAVLARDIARNMKYAKIEEAYLAGLLHDVGRLALLAAAPESYSFEFHSIDDDRLCSTEIRSVHISHPEAGAWLIERWKLDSFLADSVLYHHEEVQRVSTAHPLIRIVHLANNLGNQPADTPLPLGIGAICGVGDADLLAIHQSAQAQVRKAAELMGIDLAGLDGLAKPARAAAPAAPGANALQQRMSEEIRNRALISELSQLFARQQTQAQLLESVRINARILFELEDTAIFMLDTQGACLTALAMGEQRQRLADFSVVLANGGIISESVLQRKLALLKPSRSLLNLTEVQLLRAFGTDGLLCLPVASNSRCWGMLFAGIAGWRASELMRQEKFLMAFGNQTAQALEALENNQRQVTEQLQNLRQEQEQNSRKVAHEVNNPLSIIKNYLGVIDDKLARQQPLDNEISVLNEEIDRVGSIIKEFSGVKPTLTRAESFFEVNRIINDIVRLFRESRYLPPGVKITARVVDHPCNATGAPETLKQILINLIKNAVEAMPQGGHIEVINIGQTRVDGQDYVGLTVRDSGPGLPADVLAKLFTPVQSKKPGDNRGLGLSIVHGLVKKMGGRIECRSSRMGASFEMLLPLQRTPLSVSA